MAQPRPATGYWHDIATALALKALGLVLIYLLFFGPGKRPDITPQSVGLHLQPEVGGPP